MFSSFCFVPFFCLAVLLVLVLSVPYSRKHLVETRLQSHDSVVCDVLPSSLAIDVRTFNRLEASSVYGSAKLTSTRRPCPPAQVAGWERV